MLHETPSQRGLYTKYRPFKRFRVPLLFSITVLALKGTYVYHTKSAGTMSRSRYNYKPRVVVIFYGLPRSLFWTIESIERQITFPLQQHFRVDVSVHSYVYNSTYSNIRSEESNVELNNDEWKLLSPDFLETESVETVKLEYEGLLDKLSAFGDAWNDNFKSLRNYVLALHSLERAVSLIRASKRFYVGALIFRPDLYYLDPIDIRLLLNGIQQMKAHATIIVPCWQSWHGVNDRFMYGDFEYVMTVGQRIHAVLRYCENNREALHGERFLEWFLNFGVQGALSATSQRSMSLSCTKQRAIRIRAHGSTTKEAFTSDFNGTGFH